MKANKPHIGIYGRCNAGKSTLLNFLVGEQLAIVSPESGTTTDPVRRSVEILDFAPVVLIDTAGYDDMSSLSEQRIAKTKDTLHHVDLAILVYRGSFTESDVAFLSLIKSEGLDYILVCNSYMSHMSEISEEGALIMDFTSEEQRGMLMSEVKSTLPEHSYITQSMLGHGLNENDTVIMVCPIDSEAPSGRIILPQVQALRDALDKYLITVVIQFQQLEAVMAMGLNPQLIVTDSQVIEEVNNVVGDGAKSLVTTFSILLAELKGDIPLYQAGLRRAEQLEDGDNILILESCVHQHSCEDIGRVKIPRWLSEWSGKQLNFEFISGLSPLPDNLETFTLVVQCGGCMVTSRQLKSRLRRIAKRGVAVTNYGMLIKKIKQ